MAMAKRYGFLMLLLFVIPLITLASFAFSGADEKASPIAHRIDHDHNGHTSNAATPGAATPQALSPLPSNSTRFLSSEYFRPTLLSDCPVVEASHADTPVDRARQKFAPCLRARAGGNNTNLMLAQEVVYPLFRIRVPKFSNAEQLQRFLVLSKGQYKVCIAD
jgi:hypothetical protein